MPRRSPETLADYLVVAVCPALIMLLVGSLMWFLVDVFYQGEYKGRLLWIMAMFVIAIVGIARIAMEEGHAYASLFGAALAAAVALALVRLVQDGLLLAGPLMLLVWWAAHKLTWDCTLIDDKQDASGQGLLQQMGLDSSAPPPDRSPPGTTTRAGDIEATTTTDENPLPPWWETFLEPDRRPHAPGVWVVYFSLAALPLFGIGGWFVSDPVGRARVFGLLVIYVASGMGLLLATSFLGLRRYLRQRKLEMPIEMTSTWIVAGIVMIVAMLLVATILPRPSREYSLSQLPFTVTSAVRRASRYAIGKEGTKDDAAQNPATADASENQSSEREGGKKGSSQKSSDSSDSSSKGDKGTGQVKGDGKGKASGDSDKSQSSSDGEKGAKDSKSKSGQSKGDQKAEGRNAEAQSQEKSNETSEPTDQQQNQAPDSKPPDQQPDASQQSPPPESRWSPARTLSQLPSQLAQAAFAALRYIFFAALILGGLIAAWIYREDVAAAWKKLLAELQDLLDWWFGSKKTPDGAASTTAEPLAPSRPFASFTDPFLTGDASQMTWPQLVHYSFQALEAWGREHGCPREIGQTPHEFALALSANEPEIASQVQTLAGWYNQLAYAPRAAAGSPESLRGLWHNLRARNAPVAAI